MEGAHIIEVNDLVISMTSTRSDKKAKFPILQKMRRMPCDVDNDVYQPGVISIGPYHHKQETTSQMEQTKWESFSYILGINPERKMRDYLEAMARLEQQVRSCYASETKIGSDEFIKMILLDGCFILCILYGNGGATPLSNTSMSLSTDERSPDLDMNVHNSATGIEAAGPSQYNSGNSVYNDNGLDSIDYLKHWHTTLSVHDLVLLENQIPFFVIAKLFEVLTNRNNPIAALLEYVARFMKDLLPSYPKANFQFDQPKEIHHLLHLCHSYFEPTEMELKSSSNIRDYNCQLQSAIAGQQFLGWHRTLEYYKAGLEFRKKEICTKNPHSLLDISFCDGIVEIPSLTIDRNTYCLFRNLIAFEETCPQFGNYMTTYVVFLSQLVTMPEDVSLLTKRGIIVEQLDGGAEVSDLFKMLAEGVTFDFNGDYYLKHICHAMEMHYQMGKPRWREWVRLISSKLLGEPQESGPNYFPRRSSPEECV